MKEYIWTKKTFGDDCPANWKQIADEANEALESYKNDSPGISDEELKEYSEELIADLREDGEIFGTEARNIWYSYVYDEDDSGVWDGPGTKDLQKAISWLRSQLEEGNEDAQIEVVECDYKWTTSLCIDVIETDDILPSSPPHCIRYFDQEYQI